MKYAAKKTAMMLLTMVIVSFLAFLAFQIIPGDAAVNKLGSDATVEAVEALRHEMGLDRPFFVRYGEWVLGALRGDFGASYSYSMSVSQMLAGKLPITALLTALAFLLIVVISIPLGIFTAGHAGGRFDKALTVANQVLMAVPPFFTGVLLFPKLLSGPLMDPLSLHEQLSDPPRPGLEDFDSGLRDFILGLSMKVLLANQIGSLWRQVGNIGYESVSTPLAWMGIAAYSLQLYLDFCGYSWMALGLGRMLGFRLPRNFEHPYAARSMQDFWRRWHISLSSWFRDYVYIPLGGSREGTARTYLNLLAVWVLTGLWHGSTLNFLLWGLLLFALIALERAGWGRVLARSRVISRVYMVLMIPLSWMLFAIPSVSRIGVYLGRLFPLVSQGIAVNAGDWLQYGKQYWWLLVLGIVFSTPGPEKLWNRIRGTWLGTVILAVLFWACVYCMSVATNDPFMYFSF